MPSPWPELWAGTGVRVYRRDKGLRTQRLNADAQAASAWSTPAGGQRVSLSYTFDTVSRMRTIFGSIRHNTGVKLTEPEFRIDAPWPAPRLPGRKLAVFHPPTVRAEWPAPSRNPLPEYMQRILEWLKDDGFTVASVGYLAKGEEWLVGEYQGVDHEFMRGELHYTEVLALIARADLVVSGPGFFVPACLALKARCLIVFGGYQPAHVLVDDMAHDGWHCVEPDSPCHCVDKGHDCDKTIEDSRMREAYERARG